MATMFKLGIATNITGFAKRHFIEYREFDAVFIVPDVTDYNILRVYKDVDYTVELSTVDKARGEKLTVKKLLDILERDVDEDNIMDSNEYISERDMLEYVSNGDEIIDGVFNEWVES